MPYQRRVTIYLREKHIPQSLVTAVHVANPVDGNEVVDFATFPPRPPGSLPILAIPSGEEDSNNEPATWAYVRQSMAIINVLEEMCEQGTYGFPSSQSLFPRANALERARINEMTTLAEELTIAWNPVRSFGTGVGPFHDAAAAKEILRWVRRTLLAIDTYMQDSHRDLSTLADSDAKVTVADIVLYQFLEFTLDCYGVDITMGSGLKRIDVYGREVVDTYADVAMVCAAFRERDSTRGVQDAGEVPGEHVKAAMSAWIDGVL